VEQDHLGGVPNMLALELVTGKKRLYAIDMGPGFGAPLAEGVAGDRTDDLSVSYGRPAPHQPTNVPTLKGRHATPLGHVEELVDGYRAAYDRISRRLLDEPCRVSFLGAARACRPRAVVRSTAYCSYVLRRLEQPEGLLCEEAGETVIRASLAAPGRFWESEVHDLLQYDIPYFYQNPAECHLYHWNGDCEEENLFPASAIDSLQDSWRARSTQHRDENIARIRETLDQMQHRTID
jgi:lantibiotic modifying enzyme